METSRFPVESVTWFDAIEFCNALSRLEGLSPCYELTETKTLWVFKGESQWTWLDSGTGYRLPTEAEWGNVGEWVHDGFESYGSQAVKDPACRVASHRVFRGGS